MSFGYNQGSRCRLTQTYKAAEKQAGFIYSDEGEMISRTHNQPVSYGYDGENRLISAGSTKFYYDPSGNRLKATRNGQDTYYVYD